LTAYQTNDRPKRKKTMWKLGWEAKVLFNAIQSNDMSSGVIDVTPEANTAGVLPVPSTAH